MLCEGERVSLVLMFGATDCERCIRLLAIAQLLRGCSRVLGGWRVWAWSWLYEVAKAQRYRRTTSL